MSKRRITEIPEKIELRKVGNRLEKIYLFF